MLDANYLQSVTPSFGARSLPLRKSLEAGTQVQVQIPLPALSTALGVATMPLPLPVTGPTLLSLLLTSGALVVMVVDGRR